MNVILTGGAGFIGSHVLWQLNDRSANVLVIDKRIGSDICDKNTIDFIKNRMSQVDFIIHLAGTCSTPRSFTEPSEAFESNTHSAFNVMELARETGAKVIFTSTAKAQENDEGMRTPYGLTKYMGELIAREWFHSFDVPVVINRPGTIYGPGQHGSEESGWLGWFIKAALTEQEVTINGDGSALRDVLYVTDYVNLLMDQVDNFDKYQTKSSYHSVGGGSENSIYIKEGIEYINELVPLKYKHGPERKGDNLMLVSSNRVSDVNGWKPHIFWKDGIKRTIKYYQEHKELL